MTELHFYYNAMRKQCQKTKPVAIHPTTCRGGGFLALLCVKLIVQVNLRLTKSHKVPDEEFHHHRSMPSLKF